MRDRSKAVREGAMMIALTVILVLLTYYVPFLSGFGMFVCGIPMAALAARNGLKAALPAVLGIFAVSVIVMGSPLAALSTVLMSVLPGLAAGYCMGKDKPFFATLSVCCLTVCAGWLLELFAVDKLLTGQGVEEMIKEAAKQFEDMMNAVIGGYASKSEDGAKLAETMKAMVATAEYMIKLYFPSMVVLMSAAVGYAVVRLSGFVLRRTKIKDADTVLFSQMKAPRSMAYTAVALYVAMLFMKSGSPVWSVTANAVFVLFALIGVCGLSLADYKLRAKIRSGGARAAIYAAVFFFGGFLFIIAAYVLIFMGLFDSTRNYRGISD